MKTRKKLWFVSALLVAAGIAGCASPAADYVQAEADTWAQFDPYLDAWVDSSSLSFDQKDALHQLNVARRARVNHALAQIASGS